MPKKDNEKTTKTTNTTMYNLTDPSQTKKTRLSHKVFVNIQVVTWRGICYVIYVIPGQSSGNWWRVVQMECAWLETRDKPKSQLIIT